MDVGFLLFMSQISWQMCDIFEMRRCVCDNSRFEPEEELEVREGIGLMRGVASPCCQEIGLVALMSFFELLFSYVSSQFPSMLLLLTYP